MADKRRRDSQDSESDMGKRVKQEAGTRDAGQSGPSTRSRSGTKQASPDNTTEPVVIKANLQSASEVQAIKEAREAQCTVRRLEKQLTDLKSENSALKQQNKAQYNRALAGKFQGKHYIQEDDTIRRNFRALLKKIEDWAAMHAYQGKLQTHFNEKQLANISDILQGKYRGFEYPTMIKSKERDFTWMEGGPRATAQSIVEHKVAYDILTRPFHFLSYGKCKCGGLSEGKLEAIEHYMLSSSDEKLWTSRTLRTFYEPEQYDGRIQDPIVDDQFEEMRRNYYKYLADILLRNDDSLLFEVIEAETEEALKVIAQSLEKILATAGKLSLQLWAQDLSVSAHGLRVNDGMEKFQLGSDHVERHVIMMSAPEDIALSRLTLALVVRPEYRCERHETNGARSFKFTAAKAQVVAPWKKGRKSIKGTVVSEAVPNGLKKKAAKCQPLPEAQPKEAPKQSHDPAEVIELDTDGEGSRPAAKIALKDSQTESESQAKVQDVDAGIAETQSPAKRDIVSTSDLAEGNGTEYIDDAFFGAGDEGETTRERPQTTADILSEHEYDEAMRVPSLGAAADEASEETKPQTSTKREAPTNGSTNEESKEVLSEKGRDSSDAKHLSSPAESEQHQKLTDPNKQGQEDVTETSAFIAGSSSDDTNEALLLGALTEVTYQNNKDGSSRAFEYELVPEGSTIQLWQRYGQQVKPSCLGSTERFQDGKVIGQECEDCKNIRHDEDCLLATEQSKVSDLVQ